MTSKNIKKTIRKLGKQEVYYGDDYIWKPSHVICFNRIFPRPRSNKMKGAPYNSIRGVRHDIIYVYVFYYSGYMTRIAKARCVMMS